jgi:hypothetical protein
VYRRKRRRKESIRSGNCNKRGKGGEFNRRFHKIAPINNDIV